MVRYRALRDGSPAAAWASTATGLPDRAMSVNFARSGTSSSFSNSAMWAEAGTSSTWAPV
jgi:hypothetical protein